MFFWSTWPTTGKRDGMKKKKKERIPANGWRGVRVWTVVQCGGGKDVQEKKCLNTLLQRQKKVSAARVPAAGSCRSCHCPRTSTSVSRVRRGWSAGHLSPFSALIRSRIHDIFLAVVSFSFMENPKNKTRSSLPPPKQSKLHTVD